MKTATLPTKLRARVNIPRTQGQSQSASRLAISKVLVPTDFSLPSLDAIEFALSVVKEFKADLHLVHVSEPDYPLASLAAIPLIVPEMEVGRRVRRQLKDVAKKYSIDIRRENVHAARGLPFEQICRLARELTIDLIVIATRGNTGLKHLVLGSTAERVVRYSPCPVLVFRRTDSAPGRALNGKSDQALTIKNVLVPMDFSDCAMKGLTYAKTLARRFGAKLILLNSVAPQYYVTSDEYARYDMPILMQTAEKNARDQMRDLVQKTDWDGIAVEASLQIGHPGEQICARARDRRADMIVASTHGLTGLKHVLIGSTAEYVVRHAPCPVLVVPNHDRPALSEIGNDQ
jgi:nucleotide-binding universal stress UspA family protein